LNAQLVHVSREGPAAVPPTPLDLTDVSYQRHRRWKIRDRLSDEDIAQIIRAFKAGTAKHVLAKRYDINLRSLKKLLREERVKRKSWRDILD
jgi:hypothetical protein